MFKKLLCISIIVLLLCAVPTAARADEPMESTLPAHYLTPCPEPGLVTMHQYKKREQMNVWTPYDYSGDRLYEIVLLLHGGGLSWWNFREQAELLGHRYRVVLPILDGHAGSDRPFTTIEDNAAEIVSFIDERLGSSVLLLGGLSLGAQIALEILSERSDISSYALIESAAVIPSGVTRALIAPTFGTSYGLVKNKRFATMQFRSLHIRPALFEDYYRDTCRIEKADMIAFLRANATYRLKDAIGSVRAETHVFYGEKETRRIRRSAERIRDALPSCQLHPLSGLFHGEFSLNHADAYADAIEKIVSGASDHRQGE